MPRIIKWLLWALVVVALYASLKIVLPYIRFADIKGKMREAVLAAAMETDESIARKLAENALDDNLPLAGDYFYQVTGEDGKKFVYQPETEEQKNEYQTLARQYFLEHMTRSPQGLEIAISYQQEIYFPFNLYTHKISFEHKEGGTQLR
ncbi:hypothetical protein HY768_05860 [candidate division TA06 bacterium]|uniref:Uncharacterized protein n=1 Tax=candidate division TA06 bacterium TaxID=2250710 RepID=A0A933IB61_UNCT6|nr:hypothetical protein [candidate division TA06 bacterium]